MRSPSTEAPSAWRPRPRRIGWPLALILALAAAPAPAAELDCSEISALEELFKTGPPRRAHFLTVEDLFHRLLLRWTAGHPGEAAAELSDIEQRLSERFECLGQVLVLFRDEVPGNGEGRLGRHFLASDERQSGQVSPFVCLAALEGRTFEPSFAARPASLLAAARLYQLKHGHQLVQRRPVYARRSLGQVEALLAAHLEAAATAADRRSVVAILVLAATDLAGLNTLATHQRAASVLDRALEIDPGDELARYEAARYAEKLARYEVARDHLAVLERQAPDDTELRLRLAVNQARTGAAEAARERFATLAEARPEWVAVVAAQEHAALLARVGRPAAAAELLRRAVARFPSSEQLRIQLARLEHNRHWQSAWPLVDGLLNGWRGDAGESARLRYELGRPEWLRRRAAELDAALSGELAAIAADVRALAAEPEHRRLIGSLRVASLCHGSLPLRRLPGEPGEGPFAPGSPDYDG